MHYLRNIFVSTTLVLLTIAHYSYADTDWTELTDVKSNNGVLTATVGSNIGACRIVCSEGEVSLKNAVLKGLDLKLTIQTSLESGQSTSFAVDPSSPVSTLEVSFSGEGALKIFVKKVTVTIPGQGDDNNPQNLKDGGWTKIGSVVRKGGIVELQTDSRASQLMVKCTSGRIIINTIVVNEVNGNSTVPVAGVYASGESEVVNLGGLRQLIGLRISHGGKGSYTIYGRP